MAPSKNRAAADLREVPEPLLAHPSAREADPGTSQGVDGAADRDKVAVNRRSG